MLHYRTNIETDPTTVRDDVLHLHVGLPKTGTTLLQERLFPMHRQIDYLGKFEPGHHFKSPGITALVNDMFRRGVFQCDVEANQRRFDREVRPQMGRGRAILLSFEDFSHGSPRRRRAKMANLKAVCGDCRLLITLRRPHDFAESMYLQRLKKLNTAQEQWLSPPWIWTIEEWLDNNWSRGEKGELSHLGYADSIADWESTFGPENVGVLLYEQLRESPSQFLDALCTFLGILPVRTEDVTHGGAVNPRVTQSQVERIHALARSPVRSLLFRLAKKRRRIEMVGEFAGNGARAPLPPHWIDRIRQMTIPGNRSLAKRRGLPLEEYEYPV